MPSMASLPVSCAATACGLGAADGALSNSQLAAPSARTSRFAFRPFKPHRADLDSRAS